MIRGNSACCSRQLTIESNHWTNQITVSEVESLPLYEFRCKQCGHVFEKIQSFSAPDQPCPRCQGEVERLLSAPAIQFKGSGFYLTDYGKGGAGAAKSGNGAESGGGSSDSAGSSGAGSSGAGSGESSKSTGNGTSAAPASGGGGSSPGSSPSGSSSGSGGSSTGPSASGSGTSKST